MARRCLNRDPAQFCEFVDARFAAKARAARPSVVLRADPLVNALAQARGLTAAQLDAFFATYAQI